jgi:DNA-binding protein H-NS
MSTATENLDTIVASYKEGAAKLADHLRQQAALKTELQRSASEAEAAGFQDFAELFQELAAKLGSSSTANGKESTASARRRGRPPKPADDQPATA